MPACLPAYDHNPIEPIRALVPCAVPSTLQPPLPRFPFVNHFFDVHVHLFDGANQTKAGYVRVELSDVYVSPSTRRPPIISPANPI